MLARDLDRLRPRLHRPARAAGADRAARRLLRAGPRPPRGAAGGRGRGARGFRVDDHLAARPRRAARDLGGAVHRAALDRRRLPDLARASSCGARRSAPRRWKRSPAPPRRMLLHAFAVTALNPKSIVFFVAFVPQFLDPHAAYLPQLALCEATFLALACLNTLAYTLRRLRRPPRDPPRRGAARGEPHQRQPADRRRRARRDLARLIAHGRLHRSLRRGRGVLPAGIRQSARWSRSAASPRASRTAISRSAPATGDFILTLYEKRVKPEELPWFLGLMEHLAERGVICPLPVRGRDGAALRELAGRPAAITTFLPGVWPRRVRQEHCAPARRRARRAAPGRRRLPARRAATRSAPRAGAS